MIAEPRNTVLDLAIPGGCSAGPMSESAVTAGVDARVDWRRRRLEAVCADLKVRGVGVCLAESPCREDLYDRDRARMEIVET